MGWAIAMRWKVNLAVTDPAAENMVVESTFVVDTAEQPFRIVLYLAHQDILAMLKESASAKA
jgi:hypothetical protein